MGDHSEDDDDVRMMVGWEEGEVPLVYSRRRWTEGMEREDLVVLPMGFREERCC